jgi:hypothetical protein
MNLKTAIVLLLAAVAAAGCANKGKPVEGPKSAFGCPMGMNSGSSMDALVAAKVTTAGNVSDVKVTEMRCRLQGDLLRIDFSLANASSDVRRVSYRFEWIDEAGFKAWDDEAWKPVMLYEKSSQTLTNMAPTRKAADFRLVLLDQDKERK